ncbi:LacI family DNA-binding transcriptional regulator [Zafaria sp. Z1313]|uniref:LacI family DNA-binding transcriptional regulator n=1 Tax=Zafaria sp. Z1313 TaxID=3423202 RepID=UPI003D3035EB
MDIERDRARATAKDVARESGVSPSTVSFVLNETPGQTIPADTQERVRAAARRLGYTPHRIARALREGASRMVVLNTAGVPSGRGLGGFIAGLDDELRRLDHILLVTHRRDADSLTREVIQAFAPRAVLDLAAVFDGSEESGWEGGWVDGMAAHTLAQLRYLAERGHRHIALACPRDDIDERVVALRLSHARRAAQSLGLPEPGLVVVGPSRDEAVAALARMRRERPSVTAIAAFNDDTALLALTALRDLGMSVPSELAVMGFDEGPHGAIWQPSLTTLRIDAEAYGRRAARRALGLEAEGVPSDGTGSTIVRRESA